MAEITPLDPRPAVGFDLTMPDAVTVVEPLFGPFNNTAEIVVTNNSEDDRVFVQFVDFSDPPAVPLAAAVLATNSTAIPPGLSFTFSIGPEGNRQPLATVAEWVVIGPGSQMGLVFKAEGVVGGAFTINVTYIQMAGGFYRPGL